MRILDLDTKKNPKRTVSLLGNETATVTTEALKQANEKCFEIGQGARPREIQNRD